MLELGDIPLIAYLIGYGLLLWKVVKIYDLVPGNWFRDILWSICLACWPILLLIIIFRPKSDG